VSVDKRIGGPVGRSSGNSTARSILAGILIGVGVAGFLDETVFHQLLHWHHFYDKGSATAGLVSDGFFHAGSWICLVVGFFLMTDMQRRHVTVPKRVAAGVLLGWGGFQVYDGLFQHKVLGLHQIRYHVDLLPYDLVWNIAGGISFLIGLLLLFGQARSVAQRRDEAPVEDGT
jgi:uncharacterized membrane protein